ncbi:MAG: hypothetical protein JXB50_10070 [Spirochaetes bacterium]|nr:hypothetical protein [Spirochaetota bacterium]
MIYSKKSKIEVQIYNRLKFIEIIISDNGPGITENIMEKIFEKFYRSNQVKAGGLGLGLAICKEIAEIHKGLIFARNNKTGGASFIVQLPLEKSTIKGELK